MEGERILLVNENFEDAARRLHYENIYLRHENTRMEEAIREFVDAPTLVECGGAFNKFARIVKDLDGAKGGKDGD